MAALPKTMHAWRKHNETAGLQYEEIPVPSAPANGFLIKVLAAGVCHSDVAIVAGVGLKPPYFNDEFVLGHEGCGEIVSIGDAIPASSYAAGLKVGDRVAINAVAGCDDPACPDCPHGFPQLCANVEGSHHGLGQDGSFAEFVAVAHRAVLKVPEGVRSAAAAVTTDAVMTSHHAVVTRTGIKKEDVVFLFGLGGLGLNALQILLEIGCTLFVSDVKQGPLDEAVKLGVPRENVVPVGESVQEFVKKKGLENKIDITVDFAGAQQTFSDAEQIVRRGGTILNVGLLDPEHKTAHVSNIVKALTIKYTFGGKNVDIEQGLSKISKGTLNPRVETAPMKDLERVLEELHAGKIKSRMVLVPESVAGEERYQAIL